ncbi:MAG: hypothetical protein WEB67_00610 [Acidimicrobiia bacterium]
MQRTILALILSTALVAIGFVVARTPSAVGEDAPVAAAELSSSTAEDRSTTTEGDTTTERELPNSSSSSGPEAAALRVERTSTTVRSERVRSTTTTVAATTPTTAAKSKTTPTTKAPNTDNPPTIASGLAIPATVTYPGGLKAAGGYSITASNAETGVVWWTAPYLGTNLPYLPGSKWVAGDREGYRCGYGFVMGADGSIDGRFAFVRPPDQAYGKVNDTYMDEGQRYLDGTPYTGAGAEISEEDCTNVLSAIDYEGACRSVDERPRVAFFDGSGQVLDIRDYTHTEANNVSFNLHGFNGSRATVIACEDGLVGMIIYYDALGDGKVSVDFKGTGPYK